MCGTPGRASAVATDTVAEEGLRPRPACVYVADEDFGLRVISVADPAHPVEVGFHDTPGLALGVATDGEYAYVVDSDAGLLIYEFYGSGVEESRRPQAPGRKPKPAVMRRLPQGAAAFDATGRRVLEPRSGILFVREAVSGGRSAVDVRKVVVTR